MMRTSDSTSHFFQLIAFDAWAETLTCLWFNAPNSGEFGDWTAFITFVQRFHNLQELNVWQVFPAANSRVEHPLPVRLPKLKRLGWRYPVFLPIEAPIKYLTIDYHSNWTLERQLSNRPQLEELHLSRSKCESTRFGFLVGWLG